MGEPFDRTATIARVGFLMPGLTDAGLVELARVAGVLAGTCARDLTPATLAAEQREREGVGPTDHEPGDPAPIAGTSLAWNGADHG
jgi:hypothetical protein